MLLVRGGKTETGGEWHTSNYGGINFVTRIVDWIHNVGVTACNVMRADSQQNRQYKYNPTMWRVRVTIAAVETKLCILRVLWCRVSLSTVQKYWLLHNNDFVANFCRQRQWNSRLHVKCPIFCPILNKFGVSRQTAIKALGVTFGQNPSSGSRADKGGNIWTGRQTDGQRDRRIDGQTDGQYEANVRSSRLHESTKNVSFSWVCIRGSVYARALCVQLLFIQKLMFPSFLHWSKRNETTFCLV